MLSVKPFCEMLGCMPDPARQDASELHALVLTWLAALRSANTRAAYAADIEKFLAWCTAAGVLALGASPDDVERFRQHCVDGGSSEATVGRRLSSVSSFFRHAGIGETLNPTRGIERPAPASVSS